MVLESRREDVGGAVAERVRDQHDWAAVLLPDTVADPFVYGLAYSGVDTLVEYLRLSIAWGGFPGWSKAPELAPAALAGLRVTPTF